MSQLADSVRKRGMAIPEMDADDAKPLLDSLEMENNDPAAAKSSPSDLARVLEKVEIKIRQQISA